MQSGRVHDPWFFKFLVIYLSLYIHERFRKIEPKFWCQGLTFIWAEEVFPNYLIIC